MEAGAVGVFRRNEMALKIEGTVEYEGKVYEAFDYRRAKHGELFLNSGDEVVLATYVTNVPFIILREVKPPHEYKVGDWVRVKGKHSMYGLSDGHKLRIDEIDAQGHFWFKGSQVARCNFPTGVCLGDWQVEPCDPPAPKYRPFASAEEFEPHRNRWIARSSKGAMNVVEYSDSRVWLGAGSNPITFDDLMVWRFDDDGSPCGVLVTE